MSEFPLDFLQAVNDWQRGYSSKQKLARAEQIKKAATTVDACFRRADRPCYRQIALNPKAVWRMGEVYRLEEAVSSWTERYDVAKQFKGGVAPEGMGFLTVIFRVEPAPDQVVLNLAALYSDAGFKAACEQHKSQIKRYSDGIGRYGDVQAEVILELAEVKLADVYATGGHSSKQQGFLERPHVREILATRPPYVRKLIEHAHSNGENLFGARWLTGERKDRIVKKWVELTASLKIKYNR